MKFKSLLIAGICAMAFAGTSCTDETKYTPGTPDVTDGAYFPTTTATSIALLENQQEFTVTLCRTNTKEAANVALATDATSEFTVPAIANFAPGQESVDLTIGVDFAAIEPNKTYKFSIQIDPEMASDYGVGTLNLSVLYAPWSEWKRLGGNDEFGTYTYNNAFVGGDEQAPVYVRQALTDPDQYQYRVGDYGVESVPESDQACLTMMGYAPYNLIINYNKSTGVVTVPICATGTSYQSNMIYVADAYTYGTEVNPDFIAGIDPNRVLAMNGYNAELGRFTLMNVYYTSAWIGGNKVEYLQLPGYHREEVSVELNGQYTSPAGEVAQVFNITMSEGITATKYKVYSGSMTEAEAEAQANTLASDVEADKVTASGNIGVNLEDGDYTIVVAGVDNAGALLAWDYLTFSFSAVVADPNEGWTSLGEVLYGEDYFASVFSQAGLEVTNYLVEFQQNEESSNLFRLVDPYGEAWPYYGAFSDVYYSAPHNYLEVMIYSNGLAFVCNTEMNMNADGDEIAMGSFAYNNIVRALNSGTSFADALQAQVAAGNVGSFDGKKMTMPVRTLLWWIGEDAFYGNSNGGFQINLDPGEEEEEEGYSVKSVKKFTKSVRATAVSNLTNVRRAQKQYKSFVIDNKTWFNYRGNKTFSNKIVL